MFNMFLSPLCTYGIISCLHPGYSRYALEDKWSCCRWFCIFTTHNSGCGKVILQQVCVCSQVGGGLVSGGGGRYWWVDSILGDRFLEGVGIQGVVGKLYPLVLTSTSGH